METFWIVALVGFFNLFPLTCQGQGHGNSYNHITPEELVALKRVRSILYEDFKDYKGPFNANGFLVHIVRAKNGDVQNSVQMIRDIFKWRKQNNIDNILNEDFTRFHKEYPYWIDDGAYDGQPIATVPVWNIRKIMLGGYRDYVIRYIDKIFEDGIEHVLNTSKVTGKEITQAILIVDLNGYSARTHACFACMPFYTDFLYHLENYYPQSTSVVFLVNTPRIFTNLLDLLRPLMSEYTQSNLRLFGYDKTEYLREMLKLIPIEKLRHQFGGKLQD